nr:immunoglobulin heavy chain junction region [Macaca mulatta]MOV52452.1 immunoglobulin heavy chain junction region [Macaca mulatta]
CARNSNDWGDFRFGDYW